MYKNFHKKIELLESEVGGENLVSILSGQFDNISSEIKSRFPRLFREQEEFYKTPASARVSIINYKNKKKQPKPKTIKDFAKYLGLDEEDLLDSTSYGDFLLKLRKTDETKLENIFQNSIDACAAGPKLSLFERYEGIYMAEMAWIMPEHCNENPTKYQVAKYKFFLRIYEFLPEQNLILVEKTTRTHFNYINGIKDKNDYDDDCIRNYEWGWRGAMLTWPNDRSCILLEGKDNRAGQQFVTIHIIATNFLNRSIEDPIHGLYIANPKYLHSIAQKGPLTTATRIILRKYKQKKEDLTAEDYCEMSHDDLPDKEKILLDHFGFLSLTETQ